VLKKNEGENGGRFQQANNFIVTTKTPVHGRDRKKKRRQNTNNKEWGEEESDALKGGTVEKLKNSTVQQT